MAQILEDSPLLVAGQDADDQFGPWLKLWPACSTVWIGDVYSSGKPEHRTHFRSVAEWYPDRAGDGKLHLRLVVQARCLAERPERAPISRLSRIPCPGMRLARSSPT